MLKHMEEARARYLEKKPAAEVDWAIQNARVAAQAAGLMVNSDRKGAGHRDRCMADNVDWILAQAPPGSKIVLWAHNGHVSKAAMGSTSMGSHLAKRHGKDYVVLGFAAHKGRYTAVGQGTGLGTHAAPPSQPGSIEYYTHASGLPRMIIDLRRASKDDPTSAWLTRALDHRSIGALASDMSVSLRPPGGVRRPDRLRRHDGVEELTVRHFRACRTQPLNSAHGEHEASRPRRPQSLGHHKLRIDSRAREWYEPLTS